MGFRDYDPGLNRFLTRDAYNGALSDLNLSTDPYTQNRYAFGNGNPISNVELDGHNALSDVFSELGEAVKETGEGLLNLYATLDDASATSVGTDPQRQEEAQQQVYNTIDTLTDAGKLEDALNAEYSEDAGNPTRQHTRQAFDIATLFIGGGGGASKAGLAGKGSTATKAANAGKASGASRTGSSAGALDRLKGCLTNSFVPETKVVLADGSSKPISEIDLGDKVLTTDTATGQTAGQPVAARITGDGVKHLVTITVQAGKTASTITATDGHPFWVVDEQRWVPADELKEGDLLRTADGDTIRVVQVAAHTQTRQVYNLNVEEVHTYYVLAGDTQVLVHNCNTSGIYKSTGLSRSELEGAAIQTRDLFAKQMSGLSQSKRPTTVTAGYNIETGEYAAGGSSAAGCAEVCVANLLGGDTSKIRFTPAVLTRSTRLLEQQPVCLFCEARFGRSSFPSPETRFDSDPLQMND